MLDFVQLLPHCKKDSKLDTKSDRGVINEIAEIKVQALKGAEKHRTKGFYSRTVRGTNHCLSLTSLACTLSCAELALRSIWKQA